MEAVITLLQGDCLDILPTLPERSVQCVVTSPPYFGLRDYQTGRWEGGDPTCDHVQRRVTHREGLAKLGEQYRGGGHAQPEPVAYRAVCGRCGATRIDRQIGMEPTPAEYVAALVAVFREVRRVLRDDGVLWVNLGDSYAQDSKWGGASGAKNYTSTAGGLPRDKRQAGLSDKQLIGIPWRVAFALQDDGWILRQDVIWSKPNCMPESVRDRCTRSHEYLFMFAKRPRYFQDMDAIAEPVKQASLDRINQATFDEQTGGPKDYANGVNPSRSMRKTLENFAKGKGGRNAFRGQGHFRDGENGPANRAGRDMQDVGAGPTRNRRTVWTVATTPYSGAHFATFPEKLIEPCVLAGSAAQACEVCGAPWARVVERESNWQKRKAAGATAGNVGYSETYQNGVHGTGIDPTLGGRAAGTTGFRPTCACPDTAGAARSMVLDPFCGTATVCRVAERYGRDSIGIDLGYQELQEQRTNGVQVDMEAFL